MTTVLTRTNVWEKGGTFVNNTLYWYAKGVQALKAKPITDPTSWWFFAGMHGFDLNLWKKYLPEECKKFDLPCIDKQELFWNQCQHGTYNFLPWHRGYLLAIEMALKVEIEKLGGPKDWALPYMDYINNQELPPAFKQTHFLDKEVGLKVQNPLYMQHRYPILENWLMTSFSDFHKLLKDAIEYKDQEREKGIPQQDIKFTEQKVRDSIIKNQIKPKKGGDFSDNDIHRLSQLLTYLIGNVEKLGGPEFVNDFEKYLTERLPLSVEQTLAISHFINNNDIGFGGPFSDFTNISWSHGAIESLPHDIVHILIGGYENQSLEDITEFGALSIPASAGLDPIFYLHHANIDRMWDIWVNKHKVKNSKIYHQKNNNGYDFWQEGPIEGAFIMPLLKNGGVITYFDFVPENMEPKFEEDTCKVYNEFSLKDGLNQTINHAYRYDSLELKESNAAISQESMLLSSHLRNSKLEVKALAQKIVNALSSVDVKVHKFTDKESENSDEIKISINLRAKGLDKNLVEVLQTKKLFKTSSAKSNSVKNLRSALEKIEAVKIFDKIISIAGCEEKVTEELIDSVLDLFTINSGLLNSNGSNESQAYSVRLDVPIDLIGITSSQPSNILLARNEKGEIVGATGLFGLGAASDFDQPHGGNGLNRRMIINDNIPLEGKKIDLVLEPLIPSSKSDEKIRINTVQV